MSITPNEYQELTRRTANYDDRFQPVAYELGKAVENKHISEETGKRVHRMMKNLEIDNWALGLAGEAGECADYVKKVVHHEKELDRDHLVKELGDVMWYLSRVADHYDITLSEVMTTNIDKLAKRYPDTFNFEDANNR